MSDGRPPDSTDPGVSRWIRLHEPAHRPSSGPAGGSSRLSHHSGSSPLGRPFVVAPFAAAHAAVPAGAVTVESFLGVRLPTAGAMVDAREFGDRAPERGAHFFASCRRRCSSHAAQSEMSRPPLLTHRQRHGLRHPEHRHFAFICRLAVRRSSRPNRGCTRMPCRRRTPSRSWTCGHKASSSFLAKPHVLRGVDGL